MKLVLLGSGNVACHLGMSFRDSGHSILQVFSRNITHAQSLADELEAQAIDQLFQLQQGADAYICMISDDALLDLIANVPYSDGIWLHTAGSVDMQVFSGKMNRYGVLYPLQTFSKKRRLNMREVPLFIEGSDAKTLSEIEQLAKSVSDTVTVLNSDKRKTLHLAAVFACNFSNHLYHISSEILKEQHIPFDVMQPLIQETVAKIQRLSPREAQTGPALRNDVKLMEKQMQLLPNTQWKEIYQLLSKSIYETSGKRKK